MKRLFILISLSLVASAGKAQWSQAQGPTGATMGSLTGDTLGHVYAACDSQWFRSTNDGGTWSTMPLATSGWEGGKFCVGRSGLLFAGTWAGIYRSTNSGSSWERHAFADTAIVALFAARDGTVYVGTAPSVPPGAWNASVYRSTDDGLTWLQCAPTWAPVSVEAVVATPQGTLLASVTSHISTMSSIYCSTDSGSHWQEVYHCENLGMIYSIAAGDGGTVFAGTCTPDYGSGAGGGLLRSTDDGQTWALMTSGAPAGPVWSLQFTAPGHIALGTTGVYASKDNGGTWRAANPGLPDGSVLALAQTKTSLFAGIPGEGIWQVPLTALTSAQNRQTGAPGEFALLQNYPNPFNPVTTIEFRLPKTLHVELSIHDLLGRTVVLLVNGKMDAGTWSVAFDASGLSSGVYFCRLTAGDFVAVKRLMLLR